MHFNYNTIPNTQNSDQIHPKTRAWRFTSLQLGYKIRSDEDISHSIYDTIHSKSDTVASTLIIDTDTDTDTDTDIDTDTIHSNWNAIPFQYDAQK